MHRDNSHHIVPAAQPPEGGDSAFPFILALIAVIMLVLCLGIVVLNIIFPAVVLP